MRCVLIDVTEGQSGSVRAPTRIPLLRIRDFVSLEISLTNLELVVATAHPAKLVRRDPNADAFLIVSLPPQSLGEETAASVPLPGVPNPFSLHRARLAGGSRLIFRLPADTDELAYSAEDLLDWSALEFVAEDPTFIAPASYIEARSRQSRISPVQQ